MGSFYNSIAVCASLIEMVSVYDRKIQVIKEAFLTRCNISDVHYKLNTPNFVVAVVADSYNLSRIYQTEYHSDA